MTDAQVVGYEIHQCCDPACNLRYPVGFDELVQATDARPTDARTTDARPTDAELRCARCRGPAFVAWRAPDVEIDLAQAPAHTARPAIPPAPARPVTAVLDSLRSAYNVGSIMRIADGAGLAHVHLCGITATPHHPRVAKTALGAQNAVAWSYHAHAPDAVRRLKQDACQIVALETTAGARPLFDLQAELAPDAPVALVVGNERFGIDPAIVALADVVAQIPMRGQKASLNVAVAFGIAAYWLQMGSTTGNPTHRTLQRNQE